MRKIDVSKIPAANLARMREREANKPPRFDNKDLVTQFRAGGGQILHIRPQRAGLRAIRKTGWTRGMTIVFIQRTGRIEVATSIAHRHDSFTKKTGTKMAIEHFLAGKTIFFPVRGKHVIRDLQAAMSFIC